MKRLRFIPCQDGTLLNAADVTRVQYSVPGWDILAYVRREDAPRTVGEYGNEDAARTALGRLFRHLNGIAAGADGDEGGPQ